MKSSGIANRSKHFLFSYPRYEKQHFKLNAKIKIHVSQYVSQYVSLQT